ncbi:MAG: hypothetical protein RMA76_26880 [Deltaproteobacteria bacterium]
MKPTLYNLANTPAGPIAPDATPSRDVEIAPRGHRYVDFLEGRAGYNAVRFDMPFTTLDPWAGVAPGTLERHTAALLADPEVAEHITSAKLETPRLGYRDNTFIDVVAKSSSPKSDVELRDLLADKWPSDVLFPNVVVRMDQVVDAAAPPMHSCIRLQQLVGLKDDLVRVLDAEFDDHERTALRGWAKRVGSASRQKTGRLMLGLLHEHPKRSTDVGRATLDTMQSLGLFGDYWSEAMTILDDHFAIPADGDVLSKTKLLYNGHPTWAMTSLLPGLRAFGADQVVTWLSNRTGCAEAKSVLALEGLDASFSAHTDEEKLYADPRRHRNYTVGGFLDHAILSGWSTWGGDTMVLDKGGAWLKSLGEELPDAVTNGAVRAIVHNRDDVDALGAVKDHVWGVDFAGSRIKALEATFLGEQYALIGAREAREKLGERIGDVPVFVKGAGLLGQAVVDALDAFGMDRSKITIIDVDPEVLARAESLGFSTRHADDAPDRREDKGVLFVATPGVGFDVKTAHDYAEELVVIPLTSGGKGVDTAALRKAATHQEVTRTRERREPTPDLALTIGDTRIHLLTEGQPPNLTDDMWADRFQVTSIGITACTLQCMDLDRPGIVPFDPELDAKLIRAAETTGLLAPRPLDARDGDDPVALRRDLDSFTPKAR